MGAVFSVVKLLPQLVPLIVSGVHLAEQLFGKGTGASKKQFVLDLVKNGVLLAEGITQKDIVDDDMFLAGVGQVVDGVVAIINSTGKKGG